MAYIVLSIFFLDPPGVSLPNLVWLCISVISLLTSVCVVAVVNVVVKTANLIGKQQTRLITLAPLGGLGVVYFGLSAVLCFDFSVYSTVFFVFSLVVCFKWLLLLLALVTTSRKLIQLSSHSESLRSKSGQLIILFVVLSGFCVIGVVSPILLMLNPVDSPALDEAHAQLFAVQGLPCVLVGTVCVLYFWWLNRMSLLPSGVENKRLTTQSSRLTH